MKKIFLTSALALCVACPAFADITESSTCNDSTLGASEQGANVSIDATWSAKTYTVTYKPGAHAVANTEDFEDTATYDENYSVVAYGQGGAGMTAATGYTFAGWNTATGQTAGNYTGAEPWQRDATLDLYAAYTANTYTVTYSCGSVTLNPGTEDETTKNATGTINNQTMTYDDGYTLNDGASCSLTGYTFSGWSCTNGLSGALVNSNPASGTWQIDNGSACTAIWTPNTINIKWYNDGQQYAASDTNAATCTYDDTVTLPTEPTKTGYTFGGWTVRQNSGQNSGI